jgi:signal peptidase I
LENFRTEFTPDPESNSEENIRQMLLDILQTVAISIILFLGINLVTARIRIESVSMENTLHPGNAVLVNRLAYRFGLPERGDIIVFDPPFESPEPYIKRVIGLPGDEISIRDGTVFVNGSALSEPYLREQPAARGTWMVPEESVFVMGDNRNNSSDSRNWGPVPDENIIGRAVFVYWPLDEMGSLTSSAFAAGSP